MPTIRVDMVEGRTEDDKRQLAAKVTDAFVTVLKVNPENIKIYFFDVPVTNFAQAGVTRAAQKKKKK